MAAREGGHGFSWFVIGFLAGVAATLAVLIYYGGQRLHAAQAGPASTPGAPPVVTYQAPSPLPLTRPVPPPAPTSPAAAAAAPPPAPDQQVQEDAAATGMTSRSKGGAPQGQ